ncbi:hypothetical protein BDV11DRAFT_198516 [Aspergillus similis]
MLPSITGSGDECSPGSRRTDRPVHIGPVKTRHFFVVAEVVTSLDGNSVLVRCLLYSSRMADARAGRHVRCKLFRINIKAVIYRDRNTPALCLRLLTDLSPYDWRSRESMKMSQDVIGHAGSRIVVVLATVEEINRTRLRPKSEKLAVRMVVGYQIEY